MDLPLKISDCSITMVEELLSGLSDWKGTQDIIRMTFKAISEVLKNQSISISHLNKQLSSFTLPSLPQDLITHSDLEDLKSSIQEKISKKDFQQALSSKISSDQLAGKLNSDDFYTEIQQVHKTVEKLNEDLTRKLLDLSNTKDLQKLHMDLLEKPSWNEVQSELSKKIDQSELFDFVTKKLLRSELEDAVRYKADVKDIVSINAKLDQKTDKSYVDVTIENLTSKVNRGLLQGTESHEKGFEDKVHSIQTTIAGLQKTLKSEIENIKKQINNVLSKKVDYSEVENLYDGLKDKAEMRHLEELQEKISKDFKGVLLEFKKDLQVESKKNGFNGELIARLTEDTSKVKAQMIELLEDKKKDTVEHGQFIKNYIAGVKNEVKDMVSNIEESTNKLRDFVTESFVKKSEVSSIQNHLKTLTDQKYSKEEFSLFLSTTFTELKHELASIKDKKSQLPKPIQEVLKPEKKPISKSVKVIESHSMQDPVSIFPNIQSILHEIEAVKSEQKTNSSFLSSQLGNIIAIQESLQNDYRLKPSTKEILALIENKANIEDTNRALVEIHKELDGKIDLESIRGQLDALQTIQFCNIIGRWQWKSGEVKGSSLVPWEAQICNTSPELFLWEKDKTSIIILNSGVFAVNFAVFYKKKCRVQLNINGEVMLDSGGKNGISRNKVFSEFLMLPARARVSITVLDGIGAIGMLELIKYF